MSAREADPDVLIIGAGPTGAVAAKRFVEAGMRVVVLEQGDWPDYSKARANHADFELTMGRYWSGNPNRRQAPADYPIDDKDSDISAVMYNAVGGGTVIYAAHWQRNMPSDFRVRTLDGVGDDWPFTYEDLEPFYEQVERDFGVSGLAGDPAFPHGKPLPLPPPPLAPMGRRVAKAHNRLGWHWWPAPNAIATRPYGPLRECTQRAACMWGCVERAKGSVDITHWPQNIARGVQLITGARVRRIETHANGLVTGAVYVDRKGQEHLQKAKVVVLATNGIGTPRLLLLSASSRFPNGLANSSGLVGKRLMLHPYMSVAGLYDAPLESWLGPTGGIVLSLEFADTDESRGFPRGAQWDALAVRGPLGALDCHRELPFDERWGAGIHTLVERTLGRSFHWGLGIEDLPNEENHVS